MQRWENRSGYIFLEGPDAQEEVAIYLKDRDMNAFRATIYITFKRQSIGMSLDRRCSEALCAALNDHRYQINKYHPPASLFDHFLQPIHRPRAERKFAFIYAQSIHLPFWATPNPHIAMTKPAHLLHVFPKSIGVMTRMNFGMPLLHLLLATDTNLFRTSDSYISIDLEQPKVRQTTCRLLPPSASYNLRWSHRNAWVLPLRLLCFGLYFVTKIYVDLLWF
jgi:hypothetical protein